MKPFITCILLISLLSNVSFAQSGSNQLKEIKPKSKLKNTGLLLIGTGAVALAGGILTGIKTGGFSYEYSNTNGYVTESGRPINGVAGVLTIVGALATGTGIVFTIIGQNNLNKRKQLSFNAFPTGFNLSYNF